MVDAPALGAGGLYPAGLLQFPRINAISLPPLSPEGPGTRITMVSPSVTRRTLARNPLGVGLAVLAAVGPQPQATTAKASTESNKIVFLIGLLSISLFAARNVMTTEDYKYFNRSKIALQKFLSGRRELVGPRYRLE